MKLRDILWMLLEPESYKWRPLADKFLALEAQDSARTSKGYYDSGFILIFDRHSMGEIAGSLAGKHYEPRLVY